MNTFFIRAARSAVLATFALLFLTVQANAQTHTVFGEGSLIFPDNSFFDQQFTYTGDGNLVGNNLDLEVAQLVESVLQDTTIITAYSFDIDTGIGTITVLDCFGEEVICADVIIWIGIPQPFTWDAFDGSNPLDVFWIVSQQVESPGGGSTGEAFSEIHAIADELLDSDGDGVPDVIDVCDGGDDTVDEDEDGIPDDCDDFVGCTIPGTHTISGNGTLIGQTSPLVDSVYTYSGSADLAGDILTAIIDQLVEGDFLSDATITSEVELDVTTGLGFSTLLSCVGEPLVCDDADIGGVQPYDASASIDAADPDNISWEQNFVVDTDLGLADSLSTLLATLNDLPSEEMNDTDCDGVADADDICPLGDDNIDTDQDNVPDACDACPLDPDNNVDGDEFCGDVDVCPLDPLNDEDNDGVCGDVDQCDLGDDNVDTDGDGVADDCDTCPLDPDNDVDGDGYCGEVDNCPIVDNSDQTDTDGDLVGDACDVDADNDGICDGVQAVGGVCVEGPDNCPLIQNPDQVDTDDDGEGDACDAITVVDTDGDGVPDEEDECPLTIPGDLTGADGCSIADLCDCDAPWKNHGAYVMCVAHASEDLLDAEVISEEEKDALVSAAGQSSCGVKPKTGNNGKNR
jgi:hypothetical protein